MEIAKVSAFEPDAIGCAGSEPAAIEGAAIEGAAEAAGHPHPAWHLPLAGRGGAARLTNHPAAVH